MKAFRQGYGLSHHPRRAGAVAGAGTWRRWLVAALALVLVWPALLAPAHRHASAPGWVGASARSAVVAGQERGRAAAGDDADGCLVCRQLLDVAAYLLPSPAAHLVLAAPELADRAQMATAGFVLRQLRAWHSRAPPAPALY